MGQFESLNVLVQHLQVTDEDFIRAAGIVNNTDSGEQNPEHRKDELCHPASYTDDESVKSDAEQLSMTQYEK